MVRHLDLDLDMVTGLWYTHIPNFEGAKNTNVLLFLIWSFGGRWIFLTWVWHIDLDLDMVTGFGTAMF